MRCTLAHILIHSVALFTNHPGYCRGVVGDLAELDLKVGLDALGGNLSDTSTDPFLGTRAANVAVSTAGKWVDELDATLWAWAHLLPVCLRTEEVIAIQVLLLILVPALQWADGARIPWLPEHHLSRSDYHAYASSSLNSLRQRRGNGMPRGAVLRTSHA